jgi:hypothetical protein
MKRGWKQSNMSQHITFFILDGCNQYLNEKRMETNLVRSLRRLGRQIFVATNTSMKRGWK